MHARRLASRRNIGAEKNSCEHDAVFLSRAGSCGVYRDEGIKMRVADIWACYKQWRAKGAFFLTEPLDNHGWEWRCYMRDPDGYLIEVGQYTRMALDHLKSTLIDSFHAARCKTNSNPMGETLQIKTYGNEIS
jgi:hypothetical protein